MFHNNCDMLMSRLNIRLNISVSYCFYTPPHGTLVLHDKHLHPQNPSPGKRNRPAHMAALCGEGGVGDRGPSAKYGLALLPLQGSFGMALLPSHGARPGSRQPPGYAAMREKARPWYWYAHRASNVIGHAVARGS